MKVSIVRAGGLAGLVATIVVDSASLPAETARVLRAKVEQAGLLSLPSRLGDTTSQPDQLAYRVTVEDSGRAHTVHVNEDDLPEALGSLISWVDALPGRAERIAPPGRDG